MYEGHDQDQCCLPRDPQYGFSHIMQAIIESDPFGIDYMSVGVEKLRGIASATEMGCEYIMLTHIIHSYTPQV